MSLEGEKAKEWLMARIKTKAEVEAFELRLAKKEALDKGKEPFDLDYLYDQWPRNPDARAKSVGVYRSHEERLVEWENLYFRSFPDIATMKEFVEKMKQLQLDGFFD